MYRNDHDDADWALAYVPRGRRFVGDAKPNATAKARAKAAPKCTACGGAVPKEYAGQRCTRCIANGR